MVKACILIIEDEAPIREGLEELFLALDYEVQSASDGNEGFSVAMSSNVDVILLDVMLPGLSGFEVLERIRAQNSQVIVIMLTARGVEEDVVKGLQLGADDYVTKPFGVRELAARVEGLLARRGV
ncbi:MAG: response regulator [Deltaproteobacteria bacterium]|nr:response regulator [Deltaproteobacteria bacterium]